MRNDMDKLLVERPRLYDGSAKKGRSTDKQRFKKDPEDYPTKAPLRDKTRRTKQFNEYLAPLRKFLLSRVGKNWDKVYSEIRSNFGKDSTVHNHIFQHLWSYVEKDVVLIDGVPYKKGSGRKYADKDLQPVYNSWSKKYPSLYICPKTNILKKAKPFKEKSKETIKVHRLGKYRAALYFRGCWYEVVLADFPTSYDFDYKQNKYILSYVPYRTDAYLERQLWRGDAEKLWGLRGSTPQYAKSLKPLKKKEIKQLPFDTSDI